MLYNEHAKWFLGICISCFAFGNGGLWLMAAILILLTGLFTPSVGAMLTSGGTTTDIPPDISWFPIKIDIGDGSILSKFYRVIMNLFKPGTYLIITSIMLGIVKWFIGVKGDCFKYWPVFKRLSVFYLIAIPYPAAFLAPVGYKQAQPNLQLMAAGLIFIFANVIGDLISSRITIGNFTATLKRFREIRNVDIEEHFYEGIKFEFALYITVLRDLIFALIVLCGVLVISAICILR
jgi:hypothetical protein